LNIAVLPPPDLLDLYDSVSKGQVCLLDTLCRLLYCQSALIQEYPQSEDPFSPLFTFAQGQSQPFKNDVGFVSSIKQPQGISPSFIIDDDIAALLFRSNDYVNSYLILQVPELKHQQNLITPETEELVFHIKEALNISYKMTQQETDLKSIHYVLDHYPVPAIAIDDHLNTIFINKSARALLHTKAIQQITKNENLLKLCRNANHQPKLKQALTRSLTGTSVSSQYLHVDINGTTQPIVIAATNTLPNVFRHFSRNYVSWVYLLKPDYSNTLKSHPEFQALGLSTTETELATLLFEGKSLNEISELRHVSKQTVRKQLQSVLRKTACESQENLMLFFFENFIHYGLTQ